MRRIGVDEAGKGPVIGAMIAAAVLADPADLPDTVADSKTIPAPTRERIATTLQDDPAIEVGLAHIPVPAIDASHTDMNELTVAAQTAAIRAVPNDPTAHPIRLDASDVDPDRFAARVTADLPGAPTASAAHGADATDPVVAAASVVAKVARDTHVERLAERYDTPIGSGYPSDPTTRAFLERYIENHGELPQCARRSWQTSTDLLSAVDQTDVTQF